MKWRINGFGMFENIKESKKKVSKNSNAKKHDKNITIKKEAKKKNGIKK